MLHRRRQERDTSKALLVLNWYSANLTVKSVQCQHGCDVLEDGVFPRFYHTPERTKYMCQTQLPMLQVGPR